MNPQLTYDRTIFLALTGSHAYGLNTPESDEDYRGVCIPTEDFFLGLKRFEQQEYLGEDKVVYDIRKAFRLMSDANPNMLELLFIPKESCPVWTPYWQTIVDNKNLFLSSKVRWTYAGYAISQLKRIKNHKEWVDHPVKKPRREDFGLPVGESAIPVDHISAVIASGPYVKPEFKELAINEKRYRDAKNNWDSYNTWLKNRNKKRFALEEKYGYDLKHASHLVRLVRQGSELLKTGNLTVNRTDIDADELLAIKQGAWTYDQLLDFSDTIDSEFDKLYETTPLPKKPNFEKINELCSRICKHYMF